MKYDAVARDEYRNLFQLCKTDDSRQSEVETAITTILKGGARYQAVSEKTGVPWYLVGCLHMMECSCSFTRHIHNGNPLVRQTRDVPVGRPPAPWPVPGMSADELWLRSAVDAMQFDKLDKWEDWTIAGILYRAEAYNGFGYRSHGVDSPYLWGGCSAIYKAGKYVSDRTWSQTAVSEQIGVGVILRRMADEALVDIVI